MVFSQTGIFSGFSLEKRQLYRAGRGEGAQRLVLRVNEPKKTGACSTRARRGPNPLVSKDVRNLLADIS